MDGYINGTHANGESNGISNGHTSGDTHSIDNKPLGHETSDLTAESAPFGEHIAWVARHQELLDKCIHGRDKETIVTISGETLTLAELVAVSNHRVPAQPSAEEEVIQRIDASVQFLDDELRAGKPVYGISTGFGGSADTRTNKFADLQKALLQHHHVGVLIPSDLGRDDDVLDHLPKHRLPRNVVRGAMLARAHSLMRGHSAVRRTVIADLLKLLNLDFVPVVPLRGSISASGDLTPLSYIAGALEGNPGIYLDCRLEAGGRKTLNAREALQLAGIDPTVLGPKEGLGIMNGTTVSIAFATIALHETQHLALLTQALTGMCCEALLGSVDNYHPFIAMSHPHSGHLESAANVTRYLQESKFAGSHHSGSRTDGLYQDRYALRTASQWLGPYIEDLSLATTQLETELNSTTDNPLVDAAAHRIHHGGNFQATAVTSSTEKTRLALQNFGKLLFAQNGEVINPTLNGVLPPNLSFDDPSLSFAFKGVEINMASYMSELAFLTNPVSSHVQSAEMGNQSVNSLALISSRYTMEAVEVVSLMGAAHLYTLCQALDLQALRVEYMQLMRDQMLTEFSKVFDSKVMDQVLEVSMLAVQSGLIQAKTKDLEQQARHVADCVSMKVMTFVDQTDSVLGLKDMHTRTAAIVVSAISHARRRFAMEQSTERYLGTGSKALYRFVRTTLGVPLHRGLVEHATYDSASPEGITVPSEHRELIGTQIGVIYAAIRSGKMHQVVLGSLMR
ncbi:putative aromatic amino acid lyase, L-Aspartase, phenylalanine/histidine ammonia-lyase, active [Septoria linicola]|nr:putative aromatic amino acid lyase, L-Aspartase, phenylalanine/histidine ammonia-lyase, active [Septoria linicola]